ncbi:MAG TPA: efflux transporter periplasmic adaptor subunit, partial [Planctomycetota bacterium]|nr:efflux transporter periplasmic adaptor subunit [Planctomycetota bacterium]
PGLFVVVAAEQNPQRVPVAVPETALVYHGTEPNQAVVFVQTSPGAFEARPVEYGRRDGQYAEVRSGLQAGEQVVQGDILLLKATWLGEGGLEE